VSALGHYLEDEGIATTGISLVREHTAGYRPPRFLWVPFPLGRPFGAPHAPDFQRRVLLSALRLLERDDGPVILEDFPDDAPDSAPVDDESWVCPVSFPAPPTDPDDLAAALASEVSALAPWYALSVQRRGRTTVGLTGAEPGAVARFLTDFLDTTPQPLCAGVSLAENLKLACEDLKAFYQEAAMAKPGTPDARSVSRWFWDETAAARLFQALKPRLEGHDDPGLRLVAADYLVPRAQTHGLRRAPC
jgi:D-proline reductase (dithiol) PrdB